MGPTDRAQRLKIDTRLAVFENINALQRQRKAAIQAGDAAAVESIQADIDVLHERLDDLSFLSLEALEDSRALRRTIAQLKRAADALEDEADNIKTVADALEKGAKVIDQTVKIIEKLRRFVPIPI